MIRDLKGRIFTNLNRYPTIITIPSGPIIQAIFSDQFSGDRFIESAALAAREIAAQTSVERGPQTCTAPRGSIASTHSTACALLTRKFPMTLIVPIAAASICFILRTDPKMPPRHSPVAYRSTHRMRLQGRCWNGAIGRRIKSGCAVTGRFDTLLNKFGRFSGDAHRR
ncbi:MAG: hypothetical protein ACUVXI_01255 [bacterium]